MSIDLTLDIATVVGAVITLIALLIGIVEYKNQNTVKRAEHFHLMRKKLKENDSFQKICSLIETCDKEIMNISYGDRRDFLGFFEEIAIMMNSGIIKEHVAYYMFGYYAIRCSKCDNFWHDLNRESVYWTLFNDFVKTMIRIQDDFTFDKKDYKI